MAFSKPCVGHSAWRENTAAAARAERLATKEGQSRAVPRGCNGPGRRNFRIILAARALPATPAAQDPLGLLCKVLPVGSRRYEDKPGAPEQLILAGQEGQTRSPGVHDQGYCWRKYWPQARPKHLVPRFLPRKGPAPVVALPEHRWRRAGGDGPQNADQIPQARDGASPSLERNAVTLRENHKALSPNLAKDKDEDRPAGRESRLSFPPEPRCHRIGFRLPAVRKPPRLSTSPLLPSRQGQHHNRPRPLRSRAGKSHLATAKECPAPAPANKLKHPPAR